MAFLTTSGSSGTFKSRKFGTTPSAAPTKKDLASWLREVAQKKAGGQLPADYPATAQQFYKETTHGKILNLGIRSASLQSLMRGVAIAAKAGGDQRRWGESNALIGLAKEGSELQKFLAGEWVYTPESSNVHAIAYEHDTFKIKVIFHDGNEYHYFECGTEDATEFFMAGSKGGWVWDNLRVRGTSLGHQKPYQHVGAHGSIQRKWIETNEKVLSHLKEANRQSDEAAGNLIVGQGFAAVAPQSIPQEWIFGTAPKSSPIAHATAQANLAKAKAKGISPGRIFGRG